MSEQTTQSPDGKSSSCGSYWRRRMGWRTDGVMPSSPLLLLAGSSTDTRKTTCCQGTEVSAASQFLCIRVWYILVSHGNPTFFLLLRRRAARGLVAGLLSHRDGRDDAGLAAQTPLLLLLLQVLQDVLGPLVGARHCPRREGFLERGWAWRVDQTAQRESSGCRHTEDSEWGNAQINTKLTV